MPESSNEIQSATASIDNEDQSTQKEAHIPGGNEKNNDELVIEIRKVVEGPEIQPSKQSLIYEVLPQLRKWNEEAYTPQVISIGPIHHENKRLKAMEEHKERFFRSFVKRSKIELEYLVGTIREMEESIRGCYAETIDLTGDRFVKMILMDASFILELFFKFSSRSWTSDDPMFLKPRACAIRLDLLLLENQLPFFVIQKLHQLAFPYDSSISNYNALLELSISFFGGSSNFQFMDNLPDVEIYHFTDLLRIVQLPKKRPKRVRQHTELLYTATQLHEAGVKFGVLKSKCRFDIKFEKGVLKIPKFELDNWTEVVTRNIMALEQTRYIKNAYFADYFALMDSLINTREDVDLLCKKKILVNCIGDHNAAMSMINNLNNGIECLTLREDYIDLYKKLHSFYENPWNKWKATLKRQYFDTPWRAASTVAAIVLLVLTLIQTAFSILK